ncbi:Ras GTPase [Coemansia helicoidea]|uniref:Ras GTPase n=1 Tax=Coemansia helicoidea TaxID=1286919 RepID=A0ACC1L7A2_9FUNG|nr:Ras GTPase [Coemansia helicoidea]
MQSCMHVHVIGVGKSMLTTRYMNGNFSNEYDPTIEDSYRKQCTVDSMTCILEILDTAGQEEYAAMRDYQIRGGDCFVVVYSVADMQTLHEAESILRKIFLVKETDNVPIVLVGNKCDLPEREVTTRDGTELARRVRAGFYEASARDNLRVDDVFTQCVRRIKRLRREAGPRSAGVAECDAGQLSGQHAKQGKGLGGTRSWMQRRKSVKEANAKPQTHQSLPEYYMTHQQSGPSLRHRSHTAPLSPTKRKMSDASTTPIPIMPKRRSTTRAAARDRGLPAPPAKDGRPRTRSHTPHKCPPLPPPPPVESLLQATQTAGPDAASSLKANTNKELPVPRRRMRLPPSVCTIL